MDVVGIYCRLSDEDKNKINKGDDSESIANQKLMLTEYAINQGWHIYKVYDDDDYSGADISRPRFNDLLRDAEAGKFNIVLCKTQSRFVRDIEILEKIVHNKFAEWGIRFVSVIDRADTNVAGNKKARQINGLIDEWYLEDLSENIRNTFQTKMKNGQYVGSFSPYGYKKDPSDKHKLIIDEPAAEVVKLIYKLYLEGNGTHNIAQILYQKGIDKPAIYKKNNGSKLQIPNLSDNRLWGHTTINRILRNPIYIGILEQGKETTISYKNHKRILKDKSDWFIIEDNHEPIISKEDFYTVQELLNNKRRVGRLENKPHIFATKVRCAECGGTMIKCTTKGNAPHDTRYHYLRCKNYKQSNGVICNFSNRINYLDLKKAVEEELDMILKSYVTNDNVINMASLHINIFDFNGEVKKLKQELHNIEQQSLNQKRTLTNLYMDKANNVISESQYNIISEGIESELSKIDRRKKDISEEIEKLEVLKEKQINIENLIKNFNINDGITHEIVLETINYIEIGIPKEDGKREITIHWNF
ncbi:DNA invertase Pin-like site-specific DNA recombinase [Sedimentibacter acidaminivorans]|uniref:DNA invertase Pin-like site-specific DNA recombinase n=1 Tax=Sedimentibacter acidaminivorans TaxID=913099 RepID=A0ABS4GH79_9FIRM|nr:recombinase family protein [Sedimentibacter acidaminivorans]MBP1927053.1 DNA invertase Pin-like site-specific DNA recombinase [Sedimentibacter acidaminivorans]